MLRRVLMVTAIIGMLASPAFAQSRFEASGFFGWTISDGVSITGTPINGATYTRVDPKDSISYGFTFGVFATEQAEIEFLWSRQASTLEVTGLGAPLLSAKMNIDSYHANFVFNAGTEDTKMRPFVYIGLGATDYSNPVFPTKTLEALTRFTWAFGGGIKAYPSPHVGFKGMLRWTPTYIKSDAVGWWCDPYWGCGAIGDPQWSNQFEFSGGLLVRF